MLKDWACRLFLLRLKAEFAAAQQMGMACSLVDFETLVGHQDGQRATRKVEPARGQETALYRGWMLKPYLIC